MSVRLKLAASYAVVVALLTGAALVGIVAALQATSGGDAEALRQVAAVDATAASLRERLQTPADQAEASVAGAIAIDLALVAAGALAAIFLWAYGTRDIVRSVRAVQRFAIASAGGDLTQPIAIRSGDEFEEMSHALESMRAYLREVDRFAQRVATGDLEARIDPRSEHDRLGSSLAAMAASLRRLVEENASMELARRSEMQRQHMLSLVTREFRTTIGLIKGALSSVLARDATLDAQAEREFLIDAEAEADRLGRMVDDFAAITEVTRSGLRIDPRLTDMAVIVGEVAEDFARRNRDRRIDVRGVDRPALAEVDAARVRQAVSNLVENALAYSSAADAVRVELVRTDHMLEVVVRDAGIGIAPDHLGQIFEEFYRVDTRTDGVIRGTGLGLPIVKAVAEAHGGSVLAESEPGRGSTFAFQVPMISD